MSKAMRQMLGQPGRMGVAHGEAVRDPISDEANDPPREHPHTGSAKQLTGTGGLLEAALTRQNLQRAWKRVKANKGAVGVDGLDIEQTAQVIRQRWPEIRQALLQGRYRPSPLRKVLCWRLGFLHSHLCLARQLIWGSPIPGALISMGWPWARLTGRGHCQSGKSGRRGRLR